MLELKASASSALVDPCPIDLGRDVEFAAEVAQATGVHLVCATGLYKEESGAAPYYKFRAAFSDAVSEMTEIFIKEVKEGIGSHRHQGGRHQGRHRSASDHAVRAHVIIAAARAHKATDAPITTHTDEGTMGREQLDILAEEGVDPRASSSVTPAARRICAITSTCSTAAPISASTASASSCCIPIGCVSAALIGLLGIGFERQIVLSHDSVWCWRGRPLPVPPNSSRPMGPAPYASSTSSPRCARPASRRRKIDAMLVENPRRYFEDEADSRTQMNTDAPAYVTQRSQLATIAIAVSVAHGPRNR